MTTPYLKSNVFATWRGDFLSGLVVFLVALPLCLGIALASGAPLFSGMIAGIIGGIVIGFLSKSPISVCGPAAGLSAIVLAGISTLDSFPTFLLALLLAGILQIILGLVRAGKLVHYMPHTVIDGMLAAIGIIIILKQYKFVIGLQKSGDIFHYGVLIIGVICLLSILLWDKFKPQKLALIPSALISVIIGFIAVALFKNTNNATLMLGICDLVNLPVSNSGHEFMQQFTLPNFAELSNYKVWTIAFTIGIVASIETLLTIQATDKLSPQKTITPVNKELIAQGIGNTLSGLIGGMPITSVIVRSSANVNAGAQSKLSSIFHGIFLLLGVLFIANFLNAIPLASLAAILVLTGYKLCNPKKIMQQFKLPYTTWLPFIATIISVVMIDLLKGVAIGVVVHILLTQFAKNK